MWGLVYALHVVERVEKRVDELCGLDEESGELILHRGVDEVVLIGRDLEVLLQLHGDRVEADEMIATSSCTYFE